MMRKLALVVCFVWASFVASAYAAIWQVDLAGTGDFVSIQAAVTNAAEGDEIIVHPGTYVESVTINKTNLTLRSLNPSDPTIVASTIISRPGYTLMTLATYSKARVSGLSMKEGNTGLSGGSADCIIERCSIVSNSSRGVSSCNGTIQYNTITWNNGGGLSSCGGTIQYNNISSNKVSSGNGGGLSSCGGTIQNNTILGNSSSSSSQHSGGGGLAYCDGTIQNNTISGNTSGGGGYYSGGGGLAYCGGTIQNNTILGNTSSSGESYSGGGGLAYCSGTIQNNTISLNNSSSFGGGLAYCGGITRNNLIVDNTAAYGGGIYISGTPQIQNNTIVRNFASSSGGGVSSGSAIGIFNNILWNNLAGSYSQYNNVIPHYSCIQDGPTANNCINSNPQFVGVNDFHIKTNSPCVDVGYNLPGVFTWTDLDGGPRVVNEIVDMGCYEYGSIPEPLAGLLPLLCLCVTRFYRMR